MAKQNDEIEIKAKELQPLPKFFVMTGKKAGLNVLELSRYIASLVRPLVRHPDIGEPMQLLDEETANIVRNDPLFGFAPKYMMEGVAQTYGEDVLKNRANSDITIGAASEIAIVNEGKDGKIEIIRKKELGLENKDIFDLQSDILDVESEELASESEIELRKDDVPSLKGKKQEDEFPLP